ncbi:MAG: hypothetical protein AABZ60_03890 [Planctomycetota bacterium]
MIPSSTLEILDSLLDQFLEKIEVPLFSPNKDLLEENIQALNSPEAVESLDRDPYWPKWDSPWWRMLLLYEIGASEKIPLSILQKMKERLEHHYLSIFPLVESELPAGKTDRHILCHCALASMLKMFDACHRPLPFSWVRPWILRYGLPDGGFNCDESAYLRNPSRSSIVSTVPLLEAILETFPQKSEAELKVLDQGISYLLKRHFCRSLCKKFEIIDPLWLSPGFPRFYEYDILRGLTCVTQWSLLRDQSLPAEPLLEGLQHLFTKLNTQGALVSNRIARGREKTKRLQATGEWTSGHPTGTFPLLEQIKTEGASFYLTQELWNLLTNLKKLMNKKQLK